ncbi:elongation factor-like GTPase 1 isoform X2 [Mizuhopecten yessoensis]|uniref:elongation factor-like GTPase 1 isoform X2 n=1 Tax=Mizuhopecten yessoensis TaxID=6573 RepID=UPI000B45EF00|nr:elongation factor-like GTPase 1 isoform X2 [Mizuhopecten yessoensis]
MRTTTPEKLVQLQKNPSNIRNICILAHVDHGKTTLADSLVASNGIISQRMAGKLRYMDSREDEQTRGITMKSSAISLAVQRDAQEYLVNLIDSPGHVDFSSEVSTAVRLCDGAVVVVDVVEGVCPQTHAVLRQAWLENIKPVLVLNKLDRLIMELKMDPLEAFFHLQVLLEQVNLVTNELFTTEIMAKTSSTDGAGQEKEKSKAVSNDWTIQADDEDEERNIFFSPTQGNVVFASAYDGWGFTLNHFADMFSKKLGIKKEVLQKTLWGDFYLNSKTKRIMKGAQSKVKKPLFVQFILENIWAVYESVSVNRDAEMTEKIVKSLGLKISPRDMRHNDPRMKLQAIMGQWLSVSRAVLDVVVEKLPSPLEISEDRVEKLMCSQSQNFLSFPKATQELKDAFISCSTSDNSPVILFVSKMFPVERKMLPQFKQRPLSEAEIQQRRQQARQRHLEKMSGPTDVVNEKTKDEEVTTSQGSTVTSNGTASAVNGGGAPSVEANGIAMEIKATKKEAEEEAPTVFVAFARIYSGTVKKGQKLYVLGPKHDPSQVEEGAVRVGQSVDDLGTHDHITAFTVSDLFLFMGRELEHMDDIPAGNILGIGGLEDHILKSGTVSSTVMCPAFTDFYLDASPIVRVALEPKHAGDMVHLVRGLKLLNQADPCVQVLVQETGEHVIITAGEVHLQRCLDDLRERYAKIGLHASSPIVPFRETIINPPKVDMVNEAVQDQPIKTARAKEFEDDEEVIETGLVEMYTTNQKCCIRIRAVSLPDAVTDLLEQNVNLLKTLHGLNRAKVYGQNSKVKDTGVKDKGVKDTVLEALSHFKSSLSKAFTEEGKTWTDVIDNIWAFGPKRVGPNVLLNRVEGYDRPSVWDIQGSEGLLRDFDSNIVSGFQLATIAGPLCEEPLRGVCFVIEKWEYLDMSYAKLARISESESDPKLTDLLSSSVEKNLIIEEVDEKCNDSDKEEDSCEEVKDVIKPQRKREYGPFSGQIISCVIAGCRKAFQTQPQRLMVAMYKCNIQANSDVLGKLYGVLGKRNGSILEGDMTEGSQTFNVVATLPVVESFGFAENIRKKTSGLASPQLVFSHWQVLDVDPFWVPTTEEEYLHFGEKADSDNKARQYVNAVRKRKGLKVDEKIVEHAEKQRTLTRNK